VSFSKITDRDAFAELWCDPDVTYADLLAEFDVKSHASLYLAAKRFGLPSPKQVKRKKPHQGLPVADIAAIKARFEAGDRVGDIADDYPISEKAIYQMIKRKGWVRGGDQGKPCGLAREVAMRAAMPAVSMLRRRHRPAVRDGLIDRLGEEKIKALRRTDGKYAALQKLGEKWGTSARTMQMWWHRVRVL